ncbi:hypothetical protein HBI56_029130 [Parastagonospora nodorum]|uniref:Uncharacterized protein n=1 Tax=Phaeosphaeria nodorum (strain SN15 / ATCC MYA-4574 / FGSC 10173) TaxID=321614 RepID=Q0UZF9_PHANO|nr:hypothetical protein SNOG_02855 [Parastagonospora nodorum SN15]KAH3919627.1 hypothetical protein HBH56_016750 [Parastagonospora nodorum]EAT89586.1 hypothetical protein SNOG_02855 [Parastagonospora nodorum SN15]KAH3937558.1 hypothetical protein HBH54_017720 [Parastagonospora nodorum]KAH3990399.1 hypothetical protein HBH52_007080 [Parastagonospora nodorum]KAH4007206.1 hypothetical protein HBI10_017510 [Parastagonospora nodorum]
MLEGELYVDFGYKRVLLTPSEGDLEIPAWARNRVIPLPPSEDRNAPGSYSMVPEQSDYMLDAIFYENYYRYMDHALAPGGEGISVIQVLCMFDRGGSCLALPNSIPFSLTLSKAMTVVFGRWLGVILGYQPYYKEWTTDRETAKQRMSTSIFTSRFVRD